MLKATIKAIADLQDDDDEGPTGCLSRYRNDFERMPLPFPFLLRNIYVMRDVIVMSLER